jgi:hypothetical protein
MSQTVTQIPELLEDSIFLLALHIAEDPSDALLCLAADLIDSYQRSGSPADRAAIRSLRESLHEYGIPISAAQICLLGRGFGE